MQEVKEEDLLRAFREVGVETGHVLYVASSLMALGMMEDPLESSLRALKEAVGKEGTLVMPAFNFDFCAGKPFDRENSPAQVGVLAEAFRSMDGVHRTWSPPYHSVCAWGARAEEIAALQAVTSFGQDSAFQLLRDLGASHLLIGCNYQQGVPHFHWLEERHEVPYRFWKRFQGTIIRNGIKSEHVFFQYVRYLGNLSVTGDAEPLARSFEDAGHVKTSEVGLCKVRRFSLKSFQEFMDPIFAADPMALLDENQRTAFDAPEFKRYKNGQKP